MRTLVLSLAMSVGAAVMGASYAGAFGATVSAQTPSVSPIIATRDSTELLRTDFGTARILVGGDQTNNAFTVIEAVVQPGFEVALHQHHSTNRSTSSRGR